MGEPVTSSPSNAKASGWSFLPKRLTSQAENVPRRIDVAIVNRPAIFATPFPAGEVRNGSSRMEGISQDILVAFTGFKPSVWKAPSALAL
jgi:hypothetical protein